MPGAWHSQCCMGPLPLSWKRLWALLGDTQLGSLHPGDSMSYSISFDNFLVGKVSLK